MSVIHFGTIRKIYLIFFLALNKNFLESKKRQLLGTINIKSRYIDLAHQEENKSFFFSSSATQNKDNW